MKSSKKDLRKRGMAEQSDIELLKDMSYEDLLDMIDSPVAAERSAAVHVLAEYHFLDTQFVSRILNRLCKEKCLYTKIEICNALEKGDINTARQMLSYLGKMGSNQHKALPDKVSEKISYPLPRDIIARTLARMSISAFPAMLEVLDSDDRQKVAEVLDAIGFIVFYNQQLACLENAEYIYRIVSKFKNDAIVMWKATLCLSAFPNKETIELLEQIMLDNPNSLLSDEAIRSIELIKRKSKA